MVELFCLFENFVFLYRESLISKERDGVCVCVCVRASEEVKKEMECV